MNLAFCGLKHAHIFTLYQLAKHNPETRVLGIWDDDARALSEARGAISEAAYPSYDALLNDARVDIVAFGDAYGARGQHIIRALRAGKHVLSDKPLCTRLSELAQIEALCQQKRLRAGCMLDLRYDPALRAAGDMLRAGELGEIRAINFTGQHPLNYGARPMWYFTPELHGGTFNDLAVHGLDAVAWMTGLRGFRTRCARAFHAFARQETAFQDGAQFMGVYENGAGLIADVSYSAPASSAYQLPSYWRFNFWGDRGMLECALGGGEVLVAKEGAPIARRHADAVKEDCLSDLLARIRGDETRFADETLFETARAALTLQKDADERKETQK